MQEALESIFGPGIGLVGFVVMAIIIIPKFLTRWRGFSARKKGPVDCRERIEGQRRIHLDMNTAVKGIADHPKHGKPLDILTSDWKPIIIETVCWLLPLLLILLFVPAGHHSVRTVALVMAIPMAIVGFITLAHLHDRVIFYETGCDITVKFSSKSIDYNSLCSMTERKPMIPWMAASYILHLDDAHLVVLDGTYLKRGRQLKAILKSLDKRILTNAAQETMRRM